MAQITRTIEVPFEGCDRCRYLHLEEKVIYADGLPYVIFDRCGNENICVNAAEIAAAERRKNEINNQNVR